MKTTFGLVAACALIGLAPSAPANLIQNGSFESPTVPPFLISTLAPDMWQKTAPGGQADLAVLLNGRYGAAQDGLQYIGVKFGASVYQSFTISAPGTFSLTWFDSTEFNGPNQLSPYTASVRDSANNIAASADYDANNITGVGFWTARGINFALASGTYTLSFDGHSGPFAELSLIDNVSLVNTSQNVPDRSSSLLLVFIAGAALIPFRKLVKIEAAC